MLTIQLLGSFQIIYNGETLPALTKPRGQSLLAYLLLHHDAPQARTHLAYTFWPDSNDGQARTNLRRELHQLRQAHPLFAQYLQRDGQHVQWRMPSGSTVDAVRFQQLLQEAVQADEAMHKACYQNAIDLYQGDLLPGLYDEWVLAKREELQQAYIQALEALTKLHMTDRDYAAAVKVTQRLLQHDPLYEAGYAQLMELHALQNERARALHTYHTCATILERELGAPPGPEIELLYQRLLNADGGAEQRAVVAETGKLVGRKAEWQQVLATWRRASKGEAHGLLIEGEAGIGKTRLAEELLEWSHRQGAATARTRSYAAEGSLAYAPVIEWLRSDALRPAVAALPTVWRSEIARLRPELLTEFPDLPTPEPLTERWQRQRLFEALARAFTVDARPKLLLIDDLQWCDLETLKWLRYLLHFAPQAPLLVLGTVRTEELNVDHPLHALTRELRAVAQLTSLELAPLSAAETHALAAQVHGRALEEAAASRLFDASEGNPLFVVEMVRAGMDTAENNNGAMHPATRHPLPATRNPSPPTTLPPKVYAVIQHRLAQLSTNARGLANMAATLGRAFSFDLLVAASEESAEAVVNGLDELWRRRLIREAGADEYDFGHDRIREASYAEVSPMRRKLLHQRAASALEQVYGDDMDAVSGQMGLHCERAGMIAEAVDWYQRAGQVAQRVFAQTEAITYLESALALLDTFREDDIDIRKKIYLLLVLDYCIAHAYGAVPPRREEIYREAQTLARQIKDIDTLAEIFKRQSFFYQACGKTEQARAVADEHIKLAPSLANPLLKSDAYARSGVIDMSLGNFGSANLSMETAYSHLDQCDITLKEKMAWKSHLTHIDRWWAIIMWILGFPEQAQKTVQRLITMTPELEPSDQANVPFFASILYRNLGMNQRLWEVTQDLVDKGEKYSYRLSVQSGMVFRGWELAHRGQLMEGIALTQKGVDSFRSVGHTVLQTHRLAMLVEMHMMADQFTEAQAVLEEAFSISAEKGERFWDADLYRLQGDLLLAQDAPETQAENAYLRAIAIAQQQSAKSLELRASTALCRLWQRQGRTREAHQHLAQIYGWFTEGFDTHDLRVARELLGQLASGEGE
ncbi:MAG: AAA family ATPase [Caldilineaceae bacterium]